MDGKSSLGVRVSRKTVKRAMRFYDALIKAVESLSGKVAVEGERWREETVIYLAKEKAATIRVRERYRQKRREKKDQYDWRTYTYIPRGILVMELGGMYGRSTTFEDAAKTPIEDRVNDLLLTLIRAAHKQRKRRREAEEECRRQAVWEKEREEKLRLIEGEEAKVQELLAEVNDWHRAVRIRRYAAVVKAQAEDDGGIEQGSELAEWLIWAGQQAHRIDPLVESPPSIIDEKSKYEKRRGW